MSEGTIEGKKTAGRPRHSCVGQIERDARVRTSIEKTSDRSGWRIGVVNRSLDGKKRWVQQRKFKRF